jgi:hypothetical protein
VATERALISHSADFRQSVLLRQITMITNSHSSLDIHHVVYPVRMDSDVCRFLKKDTSANISMGALFGFLQIDMLL